MRKVGSQSVRNGRPQWHDVPDAWGVPGRECGWAGAHAATTWTPPRPPGRSGAVVCCRALEGEQEGCFSRELGPGARSPKLDVGGETVWPPDAHGQAASDLM